MSAIQKNISQSSDKYRTVMKFIYIMVKLLKIGVRFLNEVDFSSHAVNYDRWEISAGKSHTNCLYHLGHMLPKKVKDSKIELIELLQKMKISHCMRQVLQTTFFIAHRDSLFLGAGLAQSMISWKSISVHHII